MVGGMLSNLPPGVTESMIPGNRPEEAAAEALYEKLSAVLPEDTAEETLDALAAMIGQAWNDGFSAGRAEAAFDRDYSESMEEDK